MLPAIVLGAVLLGLVVLLGWFYRYSHTEAFRRGELRQAGLGFLMAVGPFFGVHPKRPEPEPSTISTPKGDAGDDPLQAMGVEVHDNRDDPPRSQG